MEILTNRFLLRDLVEEDSPAFAAYHADPRLVKLTMHIETMRLTRRGKGTRERDITIASL